MNELSAIRKDIQNRNFNTIYFLAGEVPYYNRLVSEWLLNSVLKPEEKAFNEHILYGNEVDIDYVIAQAKQYPMMSDHQLIIVKEAQNLSRTIAQLENYAKSPLASTVLVINFNNKKLDKRKKLYKNLKANNAYHEFKRIYDNQIPNLIQQIAQSMQLSVDHKSQILIADAIGNDLGRIHSELNKLKINLEKGTTITPDIVEQNIGISKDFNSFELVNAIGKKDIQKALQIAKHLGHKSSGTPLFLILSSIINFFTRLLIFHTLPKTLDKYQIAKELDVNPFFVKDYLQASKVYNLKKTTQILSFLRTADAEGKGVNISSQTDSFGILSELLFKIFAI